MGLLRSLPAVSHQHHAVILEHVDRLPVLADMIGRIEPEELGTLLRLECAFLVGELRPHMAAVETALYGKLEQLMEGRHSMAPMREEHETVRRLINELCASSELVTTMSYAQAIGLRRVVYRLHSILKVHLAEEEWYLGVLDRNLSAAEKDELARGIDHAVGTPL